MITLFIFILKVPSNSITDWVCSLTKSFSTLGKMEAGLPQKPPSTSSMPVFFFPFRQKSTKLTTLQIFYIIANMPFNFFKYALLEIYLPNIIQNH